MALLRLCNSRRQWDGWTCVFGIITWTPVASAVRKYPRLCGLRSGMTINGSSLRLSCYHLLSRRIHSCNQPQDLWWTAFPNQIFNLCLRTVWTWMPFRKFDDLRLFLFQKFLDKDVRFTRSGAFARLHHCMTSKHKYLPLSCTSVSFYILTSRSLSLRCGLNARVQTISFLDFSLVHIHSCHVVHLPLVVFKLMSSSPNFRCWPDKYVGATINAKPVVIR